MFAAPVIPDTKPVSTNGLTVLAGLRTPTATIVMMTADKILMKAMVKVIVSQVILGRGNEPDSQISESHDTLARVRGKDRMIERIIPTTPKTIEQVA